MFHGNSPKSVLLGHLISLCGALILAAACYTIVLKTHVTPHLTSLYLSSLNRLQDGRGAIATANYARLSNMLADGQGIVVFGSSELSDTSLRFTPYHFFPQVCHTSLIAYGQAQFQSLGIYALLSPLRDSLNVHTKIVILLSPGQFDNGRMLPQAFALHVNDETLLGSYWHPRARRILGNYLREQQKEFKNLTGVQKSFISNPGIFTLQYADLALSAIYDKIYFARMDFITSLQHGNPDPYPADKSYECSLQAMHQYETPARTEELAQMTNNNLYINNGIFSKIYARFKDKPIPYFQKNMNPSPEIADFEMLMGYLQNHDVHPLVIMLPLNTYAYSDADKIAPVSNQLAEFCNTHNIKFIDMGRTPYIPGMLRDTVHPGEFGFLKIDEIILKYFGIKP